VKEVSIQKRFWNRVRRIGINKCWPWLGCIATDGYGTIKIDGKQLKAHRLSYLVNIGQIPDGFVVDHICENKSCVNPDHLEAVSQKVNTIRFENNRGVNELGKQRR
jgi:hypothetical protein